MKNSLQQQVSLLYPSSARTVSKALNDLLSGVRVIRYVCVDRVEEAAKVALIVHRSSSERRQGIPYVVHPIEVAIRILELLGTAATVEQIQAALLHDSVEDEPDEVVKLRTGKSCRGLSIDEKRKLAYKEIANQFGDSVASTVEDVTNPDFVSMTRARIGRGDRRTEREIKIELYTTHVIEVLTSKTDSAVVKFADLWENAFSLHTVNDPQRLHHLKARYKALVLALPELFASLPDSHPLARLKGSIGDEVEARRSFFESAEQSPEG